MTNANDARRAHELIDAIGDGRILSSLDVDFLRSFLPDLPKQKTLEEIHKYVDDAWLEADDPELKEWLHELHAQLKGLEDAPVNAPAHPEFLETEADYQNAPEGTIVACDDSPPWHKSGSAWLSNITYGGNRAKSMAGVIREVLRWGWSK